LKAQNTVFEDIAMSSRVANYNLTGDGEPERLLAARVAANLFPLLRVKPSSARGFTEDENQPGQDRVVIMSYALWQRRNAGDPKIIGKTIRLETLAHTAVGAMSPDFQYPTRGVQFRTPLIVLLGSVLGLLLIGCCNLVNLLLARALTRSRETAVRSALGATRSRLVRQAAAELLPILALGSCIGVLAAKLGIEFMVPW